jgi:hypothetical protein
MRPWSHIWKKRVRISVDEVASPCEFLESPFGGPRRDSVVVAEEDVDVEGGLPRETLE